MTVSGVIKGTSSVARLQLLQGKVLLAEAIFVLFVLAAILRVE
jgi:hypothetical protein